MSHLAESGPIGLTPNTAIKRYFVTWAAAAFIWPGYTADELYAINKVLNDHDFPPLAVLHDLLLAAKLARHRKGFLPIIKIDKDLLEYPRILWITLAQHLLLSAGYDDTQEIEWILVLNAVNVEAHSGVTDTQFCATLTGSDDNDYHMKSLVYVHVLRPLSWLGLLHETQRSRTERFFTKTALCPVTITFQGASQMAPATAPNQSYSLNFSIPRCGPSALPFWMPKAGRLANVLFRVAGGDSFGSHPSPMICFPPPI
ncbi:hypothetical protein [Sphingobium sp.]|uniref:hypothetical protein n=1 Tax=Sphingobium sp. TaxID=1912891 RepID=UPI003B3BB3C7